MNILSSTNKTEQIEWDTIMKKGQPDRVKRYNYEKESCYI